MTANIRNKLRRELHSFYALLLISIVFACIALALGIGFGVQNLLGLIKAQSTPPIQVAFTSVLVLIGFVAFGLSLRWLITSTEVFSDAHDLRENYEKSMVSLDDHQLTWLLVRTLGYYRERRSTIQRLSLFSKIAGICFIVNGLFQLAVAAISPPSSFLGVLTTIVTFLLNLAIGVTGIYVPQYFVRYSNAWDHRLRESAESERDLQKLTAGDAG